MAATQTDTRDSMAPRRPSVGDWAKVQSLLMMRRFHSRTVERASVASYRQRRLPTADRPAIEPAASVYASSGMGWLPPSLIAPRKVPKAAAIPLLGYYLPYYATSKVAWKAYSKWPIDPSLPWSQKARWDTKLPGAEKGWDALDPDQAFAQLRLQGPNPFLLRRSSARPGEPESPMFEVDYSPLFDRAFVPVVCRFTLDETDALQPTSIRLDDTTYQPGDDHWPTAKRIANGLDARYSVFGRHLLDCHLVIGQAYALSAFALPTSHRLRSFLDFFTYGTLPVNDAAYRSLMTPSSYFIMAKFIKHEDAPLLVENFVEQFDFNNWIAPNDIEARGISAIPNHPYVSDALGAWDAFYTSVSEHVAALYDDDDAVTSDDALTEWYRALRQGLLNSGTVPALDGRDALTVLLTALLFNNVIHEVCGNLAPLFGKAEHAEEKMVVNIDHLRLAVDPANEVPVPSAHEVFLVDQAVFVSRFNVGGNNLLHVDGDRYIDDPKLQVMLKRLQGKLQTLDSERGAADRPLRFNAMLPRKWEASISF